VNAIPWKDVAKEELAVVSECRKQRSREFGHRSESPALDADLIGLGLSGGGIRAAAFHLGILQALARAKLLERVDFMSAVSGGSYIAGWLAAQSSRRSFRDLTRALSMPMGMVSESGEVSNPIIHLRRYAQYLTPRSALFADDPSTLLAAYLRNLLPNMAVFFCAVAAAILTPWLAWTWLWVGAQQIPGAMALLGLLCLAVPVVLALRNVYLRGDGNTLTDHWLDRPAMIPWLGHFPVYTGALLLSMAAASDDKQVKEFLDHFSREALRGRLADLNDGVVAVVFLGTVIAAYLFNGRHVVLATYLPTSRPKSPWWRTGTRHLSAVLLGLFAFAYCTIAGVRWLQRSPELGAPEQLRLFVFGPCVFISGLFVAASVAVAVNSRALTDISREWLNWFAGRALAGAVLGMGISYTAMYLPQFWEVLHSTERWIILWACATSTVLGIYECISTSEHRSALGRALRKISPVFFILTFSMVVARTIYDVMCGQNRHGFWAGMMSMDGTSVFGYWVAAILLAFVFSSRTAANEFSMHFVYRNRLVRCFVRSGWAAPERPDPCIDLDSRDDLPLCSLVSRTGVLGYDGPYPIFNCALNLVSGDELAFQERKAASFSLTPLYAGYSPVPTQDTHNDGLDPNGYRPTGSYSYSGGVSLGHAMTISGAAFSPNMGYLSSRPMAFMLTVLNLRLGWWLSNPRHPRGWRTATSRVRVLALMSELLGISHDRGRQIYLSDGGHFENTGLYELVKRRVRAIILSDATNDPSIEFVDIGKAIQRIRIDHGVEIELTESGAEHSDAPMLFGKIRYNQRGWGSDGILVVLKCRLTGHEPLEVKAHSDSNKDFPHDDTRNQWFNESKFESYRRLGNHVGERLANRLEDLYLPALTETEIVSRLCSAAGFDVAGGRA